MTVSPTARLDDAETDCDPYAYVQLDQVRRQHVKGRRAFFCLKQCLSSLAHQGKAGFLLSKTVPFFSSTSREGGLSSV